MPVLQKLKQNLEVQTAVYSELCKLAELKREALVSNKLNELEAIVVREEQLLLKAGHLEKERLLWAEQIGKTMGKAPEDLTLAELAERYPVLQSVREDMDQVVSNLQEKHELNTQLLHQAMKVVDFSLGLMTHQTGTTYNRPGQKEPEVPKKARLLDRSV
ncbi:MAG: flagellar protein FlgN [Desulfitobacterium hafniense]|nr:flagellar protein FlgN [Desulfitobacterium hafniense]